MISTFSRKIPKINFWENVYWIVLLFRVLFINGLKNPSKNHIHRNASSNFQDLILDTNKIIWRRKIPKLSFEIFPIKFNWIELRRVFRKLDQAHIFWGEKSKYEISCWSVPWIQAESMIRTLLQQDNSLEAKNKWSTKLI
jgi:hypothetical protein